MSLAVSRMHISKKGRCWCQRATWKTCLSINAVYSRLALTLLTCKNKELTQPVRGAAAVGRSALQRTKACSRSATNGIYLERNNKFI